MFALRCCESLDPMPEEAAIRRAVYASPGQGYNTFRDDVPAQSAGHSARNDKQRADAMANFWRVLLCRVRLRGWRPVCSAPGKRRLLLGFLVVLFLNHRRRGDRIV